MGSNHVKFLFNAPNEIHAKLLNYSCPLVSTQSPFGDVLPGASVDLQVAVTKTQATLGLIAIGEYLFGEAALGLQTGRQDVLFWDPAHLLTFDIVPIVKFAVPQTGLLRPDGL